MYIARRIMAPKKQQQTNIYLLKNADTARQQADSSIKSAFMKKKKSN